MTEKESICLNCIYGSQPFGYYPIVCVHGRKSVEMYHDKRSCKHFDRCPEPEVEVQEPQTPFQVIKGGKNGWVNITQEQIDKSKWNK